MGKSHKEIKASGISRELQDKINVRLTPTRGESTSFNWEPIALIAHDVVLRRGEIERLVSSTQLEPQFQKQKTCFLLMTHFIEAVKAMKFSKIIGITCIRSKDHSLCPPRYFGPESIGEKMGGEKTTIILSSHWSTRQEDGSVKKQKNNLAVWIKTLET